MRVGTVAFNNYFSEHDKATQYAALNRELIAYRILTTVNAKENIKLLDSTHNSITKKEIGGEEVYIHILNFRPYFFINNCSSIHFC